MHFARSMKFSFDMMTKARQRDWRVEMEEIDRNRTSYGNLG